jgi:beta-phosphoglucomutase-like phosphatase (HAD superfamily)
MSAYSHIKNGQSPVVIRLIFLWDGGGYLVEGKMLVIFDLYTLRGRDAESPDPGVRAALEDLERHGVKIAVISHQGGPLWRAWTKDPRYPDAPEVAKRLTETAEMYSSLRSALWLVSLHDQRVNLEDDRQRAVAAALSRAAQPLWVFSSVSPGWRRPEPGMIVEACKRRETKPQHAVVVGRKPRDRTAAARAGVRYLTGTALREPGGGRRLLSLLGMWIDA